MDHDRIICISTADSRKSKNWQCVQMKWSELCEKLRAPFRSAETMDEYMSLNKAAQDELKDVGGFVGGRLSDPRRKANNVTGRDVITLDFDGIPANGAADVLLRLERLCVSYCVYSTRKHCAAAPRLRIIIPLDRTVTADEYEPCARKIAEWIGIEMADPSTFEVARLMYWPSCSADGQYIYRRADKSFVSADMLLAQYADWRDVSRWPGVPGKQSAANLAVKQSDPESKTGVVGAFCRVYDVYRAIDELLPGIYEPVDASPDRYTYLGGSTTGGAVVYDAGKFLYSHHATDPCGGRLVNAFDLVRLHKFADLDDEARQNTPTCKLPSYLTMCRAAAEIPEIRDLMASERGKEARGEFEWIVENPDIDLDVFCGNLAKQTLTLSVLRDTLKALKLSVRQCVINHRISIYGAPETWSVENTENNLPVYLRDFYIACKVKGSCKTDICDRLDVIADENRYNPVQEVMSAVVWTGFDWIKYIAETIIGTTDPFDALLIKKWLWQSIAIALNDERAPYGGDGALVLQGGQGIGKTSFFREICPWPELFIEGKFVDVRDKDSIIQATENWICELGEMERMTRADDKTLKAMITGAVDVYRTPYARKAVRRARRTSFCGSVNPETFLVDDTGSRRYWVVKAEKIDSAALRDLPLEDKFQIWAQAYSLYRQDPQGFRLTREERAELDARNEDHTVVLPGELEILEQLDFNMPPDKWQLVRPAQLHIQGHITPERIGRALSKIAKKYAETGVRGEHTKHGTVWFLPLKYPV